MNERNEAIRKLRAAIERLDEYGAPSDDSAVMIDDGPCTYELLDGETGPRLTLTDLRAIVAPVSESEAYATVNELFAE